MEPDEMRKIIFGFRDKYPDVSGLNCTEMKQVLDGTLVLIKHRGRYTVATEIPKQTIPKVKQPPELWYKRKAYRVDTKWAEVIGQAEQFVGDIMYELADEDMTKVEMMSNEDLKLCRAEALFHVMGDTDVTEALEYWMRRGF